MSEAEPGSPLACRGAPRDLGRDQGEVWRTAVRREAGPALPAAARALLRRALAPASPAARVHRDLTRYFPHLAERSLGLARAAGLPVVALTARLARQLGAPEAEAERVAALLPERTAGGPWLGRSLGPAALRAAVLRASEPESGLRSLEVVDAALPGAWAGVNEHGLAAAATALPAGPGSLAGCAAPATLLVQECLQRFDGLEGALAWCERRPAGGVASLLLVDARGRAALVGIEGRRRRVLPPAQGVLVGLAPADGAERLAKRLRESAGADAGDPRAEGPVDAVVLARALAATPGAAAVVLVDPAGRRVGLAPTGGPARWASLAPAGAA